MICYKNVVDVASLKLYISTWNCGINDASYKRKVDYSGEKMVIRSLSKGLVLWLSRGGSSSYTKANSLSIVYFLINFYVQSLATNLIVALVYNFFLKN